MATRQTEIRRAVQAELDKLGVSRYHFGVTRGSCHQYAEFVAGGRRRRFLFSLTPSTHNSTPKTVSKLRRRYREWSDA